MKTISFSQEWMYMVARLIRMTSNFTRSAEIKFSAQAQNPIENRTARKLIDLAWEGIIPVVMFEQLVITGLLATQGQSLKLFQGRARERTQLLKQYEIEEVGFGIGFNHPFRSWPVKDHAIAIVSIKVGE